MESTKESVVTPMQGKSLARAIKAVAHPQRLAILQWLRDPVANFEEQKVDATQYGVCVSSVRLRCEVSQSTASAFMSTLAAAALVRVTRIGQWTYYARDEEAIHQFRDGLQQAL